MNNNGGHLPQHLTPAAVAALALASFSRPSYRPQQYPQHPLQANALGYSLSSTYVPQPEQAPPSPFPSARPTQRPPHPPFRPQTALHPRPPSGSQRCTHKDCTYSGSADDLSVHMMDRHLVFPPGWSDATKKRKRDEHPTPIPGTGILLNTPEAIDAWIAERRARWPSAARVAEKVTHAEQARHRGEIYDGRPMKRGRSSSLGRNSGKPSFGRGQLQPSRPQGRGRGSFRGRGGPQYHNAQRLSSSHADGHAVPVVAEHIRERSLSPYSDPSSDDDGSGSDVDPVADAVSSRPPPAVSTSSAEPSRILQPTHIRRPRPSQPQERTRSNGDLMRALLAPEIRSTVSRLSQAIRFLVSNDFLVGFEEKVGDADNMPPVVLLENDD